MTAFFDWICFVSLVLAGSNLPHQPSFALLFHPSTLGQSVCSKDRNLRIIFMSFSRAGRRGHI